jgi:hypothetical protein
MSLVLREYTEAEFPPQSYGLSGGSPSEKGMHIYYSSSMPYLTRIKACG